MIYLGFLFIVVFLIVVYRNVNAVSPIVPIIAIVGWNGVAMYVFGIDYNPMTACLGSMTIGIAAEWTILVMERTLKSGRLPLILLKRLKIVSERLDLLFWFQGLLRSLDFQHYSLLPFQSSVILA